MKRNLKKLTTIAMFSAIIVVLQIISTYINNGGFPITLTLVPIIIVGAIYGPMMSALMGLIFGVMVDIMVVTGADPSGATMLAYAPVITLVLCIVKGTLAGYFSGSAYKIISQKSEITAIVVAAAIAPITNTVVFYIGLVLFFEGSFADMMKYLISFNFILEFLLNILLAPGICRLIKSFKKSNA